MTLSFAHRKATQVLNFFARKEGGEINKMKALKLVFFADRYHLRLFGRPITNDEYLAMEYGPVPSGCKELAEMSDYLDSHERSYAEKFLKRSGQHDFASIAEVDEPVFSKSDLGALEFSWKHFGKYDQFRLADITHEYPEWKRHETALKSPDVSRIGMSYRHFLEDAPAEAYLAPEQETPDTRHAVVACRTPTTIDPGPKLSAEDRALREEELTEMLQIESLWA